MSTVTHLFLTLELLTNHLLEYLSHSLPGTKVKLAS